MGHVGSKTSSVGQILEKPLVRSRDHLFSSIIMKLGQNVLMKCLTSMKIGYIGSKTSSVGQILEKPCVLSRGHIFGPIIMKLDQNVCLDVISDEFENGSCRVKSYVVRSNVKKILMNAPEATF